MASEIIRTSEDRWFERLTHAYKDRRDIVVLDDANVGLDPASQTLLDMARVGKITSRELAGAAASLGVSLVGVGMLVFAWLDPEPTSKLTALVVGGGLVAATGGMYAARLLTRVKPPSVRVSPQAAGLEIGWD